MDTTKLLAELNALASRLSQLRNDISMQRYEVEATTARCNEIATQLQATITSVAPTHVLCAWHYNAYTGAWHALACSAPPRKGNKPPAQGELCSSCTLPIHITLT